MRIDEARARGVPVFADQYPYEASSTIAARGAAARRRGSRERGAGGRDARTSGGAAARSAIVIASYQPDPSLQGKTLARDRERSRPDARGRGASSCSTQGSAVDRLVQHVGRGHPAHHDARRTRWRRATAALTSPGAGVAAPARQRRLRAPSRRLRSRAGRRHAGVRDPLDDQPAGDGVRHEGSRRHPRRRGRRRRRSSIRRHSRSRDLRGARISSRRGCRGCSSTACRGQSNGKFTGALSGQGPATERALACSVRRSADRLWSCHDRIVRALAGRAW